MDGDENQYMITELTLNLLEKFLSLLQLFDKLRNETCMVRLSGTIQFTTN